MRKLIYVIIPIILVTVLLPFLSSVLRSKVQVLAPGFDVVVSDGAPNGVPTPVVQSSVFCAAWNGTNYNTPLIIHAGPHKTATTTLQTLLEVNRHLMLKTTGLTYMGKFTYFHEKKCPEDVPFCLDNDFIDGSTPGSVAKFEFEMRKHLGGGGVVLSGEGFSKIMSRKHTNVLPGHRKDLSLASLRDMQGCFDMTIVLAYRRYFEWIVSAYNSLQKFRKGRSNYNWPTEGGHYYGKDDVTVDAASENDGTFKMWYEGLHDGQKCPGCTYNWVKFWGSQHHPTDWTARFFQRSFPGIRVSVYNLHQEGEIFSNFVCQTVPGSKNFCDALRRGEGEPAPSMNPTVPFEHDILAAAAHAAGLITTKAPVPKREYVRKKFLDAFPDVPSRPSMKYHCLTEDVLEKLLATSIQYEKTVYVKYFSPPQEGEERTRFFKGLELEQRNSFEEYIQEKKFCNWDVDYILEHDLEIRNWFKNLK